MAIDEAHIRRKLRAYLVSLGWFSIHIPDFGKAEASKLDLVCMTHFVDWRNPQGKGMFIEVKKADITWDSTKGRFSCTFNAKDIPNTQRKNLDNRVQEQWATFLAVGQVLKTNKRIEREFFMAPWKEWLQYEYEQGWESLDAHGTTIEWEKIKVEHPEWFWVRVKKYHEFEPSPEWVNLNEWLQNNYQFGLEEYKDLSMRRSEKNNGK